MSPRRSSTPQQTIHRGTLRLFPWLSTLALIASTCAALSASGQEPPPEQGSAPESFTIDAPATGVPGSEIAVRWSGAGETYDRIVAVEAGAADDARSLKSATVYAGKETVSFALPDAEGAFELRYFQRSTGAVMARQPITLADVPTQLMADDEADIGNTLQVTFEGSGNRYDRVELWATDPTTGDPTSDSAATGIGISGGKTTVALKLPELAGSYELRYVTRENKRVLARRPLQINAVDSALEAIANADLGAKLEVRWQGPGNNYDRIELWSSQEDASKAAAVAAILNERNPVTLTLPEQPGSYELRYVTAREGHVLARRQLVVGAVATSLDAPERTLADSPLWVAWTGPGNNYDRIALTEPGGSPKGEALTSAAILNQRSPVLLNVPAELDGVYTLHYVLARSGETLASREVLVQPAGRLAVRWEEDRQLATHSAGSALAVVLDASGSMLQRTDGGERRIEVAKRVLTELIRDELSEGSGFALRVFGHREADSCRTDLELPLAPLDQAAAIARVETINAMNLAKTPIAASLEAVASDLAGARGSRNVILITDGEETCEGDPEATIRSLRSRGLNLALSIVSFGVSDEELKATFDRWATLGGGDYFDTDSAEALAQSLRSVISGPFQALDAAGNVVVEGIIGGSEVVLPAGVYRLQRPGGSVLAEAVRVIEDETAIVAL